MNDFDLNNSKENRDLTPNCDKEAVSGENQEKSTNTYSNEHSYKNTYSEYGPNHYSQHSYSSYDSKNQGYGYNGQPYYSTPNNSEYRQPYYSSGSYYQQPYNQSKPYMNTPPLKNKGASKAFVICVVVFSVVISYVVGMLTTTMLNGTINDLTQLGAIGGGNDVIIQYSPKDENPPVITEKGGVAYVASLVSNTVVEVTTETKTTDSYYGQYITQGAGSGVIVSTNDTGSYILTCAHVIEGATKITVKLKDGNTYEADSFLCDTESDIGVVKLNVKGLPYAQIGDYSKVVVGEEVVAIGNPLGTLGGSVTNGVISALDRDIIIDGTTYHLLQTNAEINPGNSGGGLFNLEGELIGIVNAKSSGENVEGLGFAIPVDDAVEIMTELLTNGYVSGRVKLGFSLIEVLSQEQAMHWIRYSRYFTDYGIYIITSEDPQFKEGDLLIAINSIKVTSYADLKALLQKFEVGQTVKVTYSRLGANNKPQIFEADLVLKEKTPEDSK